MKYSKEQLHEIIQKNDQLERGERSRYLKSIGLTRVQIHRARKQLGEEAIIRKKYVTEFLEKLNVQLPEVTITVDGDFCHPRVTRK